MNATERVDTASLVLERCADTARRLSAEGDTLGAYQALGMAVTAARQAADVLALETLHGPTVAPGLRAVDPSAHLAVA